MKQKKQGGKKKHLLQMLALDCLALMVKADDKELKKPRVGKFLLLPAH